MNISCNPICLLYYVFIMLLTVNVAQSKEVTCGMATGFPPYQFKAQGQETGFDVDIIRAIFNQSNMKLTLIQADWDDIVNKLRFGRIDCVIGMEVNELRLNYFEFSTSYYDRYSVIFIKKNNASINKIEDLYKKVITGDKHSTTEIYWKEQGIKNKIRIWQVKSKEQSMQLLFEGKVEAAIMPKEVGIYLAKQIGLDVKILENIDTGSPVAIAVNIGNTELLNMINRRLELLKNTGYIKKQYALWFESEGL